MSIIPENLINPANIKLLAAQRELYSSAKRVFFLQFCFSVLLAAIISFFILAHEEFAVYGAIYGILFLIIDEVVFNPIINKKKQKAVSIQELFDCTVLNIKESPIKSANIVYEEDINDNNESHANKESRIAALKNWYPEELSALTDENVATLICQRANCRWDSKLRTRYKYLLLGILILVPAILIIIGSAKNLKLTEMILIINTLIPFFALLLKEYSGHSQAEQRLQRINTYCQDIFTKVVGQKLDSNLLPDISRSIQDEIYEHRVSSPFIFDFIYYKFRSVDEEQMKQNTKEQIAAIQSIPNKPQSH